MHLSLLGQTEVFYNLTTTTNKQGTDASRAYNQVGVINRDEPTLVEEITTFSEAAEKTDSSRLVTSVPIIPSNPYFTESIVQFLSRPYPIADFNWDSTTGAGVRIGSWSFPEELLNIEAIWRKLENFQFFKAGIRLSIRINGTKFHYGKLLVNWSPQAARVPDQNYEKDNIYSASGFPHVIISPTENEVHEFVMPFSVPFNYIDLLEFQQVPDIFNIGYLNMFVLNPLTSASPIQPVGVTIFAAFENPQIAGYTAEIYDKPALRTITSQMEVVRPNLGFGTISKSSRTNKVGKKVRWVAQGLDDAVVKPSPSTNVKVNEGHHDMEAHVKSNTHMLSGVLEKVSSLATAMIPIPGLGSALSVAATVTGVASKVARSLGYCNPLSLHMPYRMRLTYPILSHTHGIDQAISLSITPDNKVSSSMELLGGLEVESDIYYIASTPTLLKTVEFGSTVSGEILLEIPVAPSTVPRDSDYYYPSELAYVSSMFRYWRGSIKFCLQIVASAFHSLRLRVFWSPVRLTGDARTEPILQSNCISRIIDIQEETELHFSIPYLAATPYLHLNSWDQVGDDRVSNGYLYIVTVNPVAYPDTNIPNMYLNLWTMAGEDLQLAAPFMPRPGFATPVFPSKMMPSNMLQAQWGTQTQMRDAGGPPLIPASGMYDENVLHGDHVTSVKELYKRYRQLGVLETSADSDVTASLCGFGMENTPLDTYEYVDFYRWIKGIFRFARGSFTYMIMNYNSTKPMNSVAKLNYTSSSHLPAVFTTTDSDIASASLGDGMNIVTRTDLSANEVHVPFYAGEYAYPMTDLGVDTFNPIPVLDVRIKKELISTEVGSIPMYARPGDDFEMAFLVGPPRVAFHPSDQGSWNQLDTARTVDTGDGQITTEFDYTFTRSGPYIVEYDPMNPYQASNEESTSNFLADPVNSDTLGAIKVDAEGTNRNSYSSYSDAQMTTDPKVAKLKYANIGDIVSIRVNSSSTDTDLTVERTTVLTINQFNSLREFPSTAKWNQLLHQQTTLDKVNGGSTIVTIEFPNYGPYYVWCEFEGWSSPTHVGASNNITLASRSGSGDSFIYRNYMDQNERISMDTTVPTLNGGLYGYISQKEIPLTKFFDWTIEGNPENPTALGDVYIYCSQYY